MYDDYDDYLDELDDELDSYEDEIDGYDDELSRLEDEESFLDAMYGIQTDKDDKKPNNGDFESLDYDHIELAGSSILEHR